VEGEVTKKSSLTTEIATHDLHHIWVRGLDLTQDLMGKLTFGDVVFLLVGGRLPDERERRLVDAILISLVEHGLTPSAVISRVTYSVAPEAIQGAVAAGLLGVGTFVLGSMEECGQLLSRVEAEVKGGATAETAVAKIVAEYRTAKKRLPGMGHALHTEGDPRASRLLAIAEECGKRGSYVQSLEELARQASATAGKQLPLNVTGAVAAVLLELGVPWQLHRGFALISRTAGLVAHIGEELTSPITPAFRQLTRDEGGTNGSPSRPR
jgi:citrate synthase